MVNAAAVFIRRETNTDVNIDKEIILCVKDVMLIVRDTIQYRMYWMH